MKKSQKESKTPSLNVVYPRTLGILCVIFAFLSLSPFPFFGPAFAGASVALGIIYIRKSHRKTLACIGIVLAIIGLVYSTYGFALFANHEIAKDKIVDPDTLKQQQKDLEKYFPQSYELGFDRGNLETYYSGAIDLPFNGTKKQFNILLSYRAEYYTSNNKSAFKVWGEYIQPEQFNDYAIVMLNEIRSFTYPQASNNNPLSQPVLKEYNNHAYVYSYRNSTSFNSLCDSCWFSSGKVFFPEEKTVITVTFFKKAGQTYQEAVSNTEAVLREMIDAAATTN
ncbi:MAG TPA: hypothetical protein VHA12_01055 [Candidatus Nanoarchaeia archaeon]|nr:hypothetical protein [Candidatus Nanoarchaeia archaeon]